MEQPIMNSEAPMRIHIDPEAKPEVRLLTKPILVPIHWKADVAKQLEEDVRKGVLERVPIGVPSVWQSTRVPTLALQ